MDNYLTMKAKPGKWQRLAENAAALLLTSALVCWGFIAVVGFAADGFLPVVHSLMLLVAIPFVLLLCWLTERKRARIHARAISGALAMAERKEIPCEELEKITGIRGVGLVIARLTAKGLLRDVVVIRDMVRTGEEKLRQAACAYCGAQLTFRTAGMEKCPSCGSASIKY